eukprot:12403682-Karenia_brevis.AAC.1
MENLRARPATNSFSALSYSVPVQADVAAAPRVSRSLFGYVMIFNFHALKSANVGTSSYKL